VAAFMELALYDPRLAITPARPGDPDARAIFFTSVDVGPLFGELLEVQIAEMFHILRIKDTEETEKHRDENRLQSAPQCPLPLCPLLL
jgi:SAM-dependent MidA family methyltransferase